MKISDLEKILAGLMQESGDLEVLFSSDEEGNNLYENMAPDIIFFNNENKVVLYPFGETVEQ